MLHLWIDRVCIYLHPDRVVLVRLSGLFRRRVTVKQVVPVNGTREYLWSGALLVLEAILKQQEWQHARAQVILSGDLVRYRTAPWDDRLNLEERTVLLHHRFEEVYGESMRTWQVAIADVGYGKQGLACAFDSRLIEDLRETFARSTLKLISVQPLLMAAFNRWRRQISSQGAWFVFAESSRLTIALIQNGEWQGIRSKTCEPGCESTLELLLEREALHHGIEVATMPIYFIQPDRPTFRPELQQKQVVQVLRLPLRIGFSPEGDRDVAIALC